MNILLELSARSATEGPLPQAFSPNNPFAFASASSVPSVSQIKGTYHPRKQGISPKKHLFLEHEKPSNFPPEHLQLRQPLPCQLLTLNKRPRAASEARPHYIQCISCLRFRGREFGS